MHAGIIEHEFLHAIGLYHHQVHFQHSNNQLHYSNCNNCMPLDSTTTRWFSFCTETIAKQQSMCCNVLRSKKEEDCFVSGLKWV